MTMSQSERRSLKRLLARHGLDAVLEGIHAACRDLYEEAGSPEDAERWFAAVRATALDGWWLDDEGRAAPARIIPAAASA
jgi:hypothetical protein